MRRTRALQRPECPFDVGRSVVQVRRETEVAGAKGDLNSFFAEILAERGVFLWIADQRDRARGDSGSEATVNSTTLQALPLIRHRLPLLFCGEVVRKSTLST
jgi:hypothetical protein